MANALARLYHPRRPQATALYQVVAENLSLFLDVYDEQFLPRFGFLRSVARKTLQQYLTCGLFRYGFARARCLSCPREFLIAFSCQKRGVCPSCAAKRVELFCSFVHEEVLERVPHRQFVFVLPKRFRCFFQGQAKMLTQLTRAMHQSLTQFFRIGLGLAQAKPGVVACIQTFGDTLHPHTHLHILCTEGAFTDQGFVPFCFDPEDLKVLESLFAQKVFALLLQTKKITPWIKEQMQTWKHSGFSVDASVHILPGNKPALFRLLRYMARPPVAKDRLAYDRKTGSVTLFSAKDKARVVATYNALEFLALLPLQVPPKGSHLIRYFGWYASRCRFLRSQQPKPSSLTPVTADSPTQKERRKRWAQLIQQVFEVNPLHCTACGSEMRIVAFVMKAAQIETLWLALHLPAEQPSARGPPSWFLAVKAKEWIQENPDLYPPQEDLPQDGPAIDLYAQDPVFAD